MPNAARRRSRWRAWSSVDFQRADLRRRRQRAGAREATRSRGWPTCKGKKIAVIPGTTTEPALAARAQGHRASTADARAGQGRRRGRGRCCSAGKVDAYAGDRVVLARLKLARRPGDELELMQQRFLVRAVRRSSLRRDDPDFRLAVNRALVALYKSGDIDPIYMRWLAPLGTPGPAAQRDVLPQFASRLTTRAIAARCDRCSLVARAAQRSRRAPATACDNCGVVQSIAPVTERQQWTPLGSVAPGTRRRRAGGSRAATTQLSIGPGFTNQGMVVVGAAGGAAYAQKPNAYQRQRWDVTIKMDSGAAARRDRCLRAAASRKATACACSATSSSWSIPRRPRVMTDGGARDHRRIRWAAACWRCRAAWTPRSITDVWRDRRAARWPTRRRGASSSMPAASTIATAPASRCFVDLLRHPRERAGRDREPASPRSTALLKQFDPSILEHDLDPEPPRGPAIEEIGAHRRRSSGATSATQVDVRRRDDVARSRTPSAIRRRVRWRDVWRICEQRRRRRAADRRADLVPARHDPRVPVGGADEALRRRDLRRRPDRPRRCCASWGR